MTQERSGASLRGFASMDVDKQRAIARKGGANVPHEKRSFAQDRALAVDAGRKGERAVAAQARSFSANRDLASQAGRKGGQATQSADRRRLRERNLTTDFPLADEPGMQVSRPKAAQVSKTCDPKRMTTRIKKSRSVAI